MDKFKTYLSVALKYQFWILCGAILLTSLGCWWWATKDLSVQFQRRKSEIDDHFKKAKVQQDHPNEEVVKRINEQHEELKKGVYHAWETLYKEEKEKNPFPVKELGEDFKRLFESRKPNEEIPRPDRELYQRFIKDYLPKLQQLIDVRRPKEETEEKAAGGERAAGPVPPAGGMGPIGGTHGNMPGMPVMPGHGAGDETEWIGIVDWDDNDYARLLQRFDWREAPSTQAVVLAQEDLWVFEALLRVIKGANEGATNQANAAVKRIISLDIGRDAAVAGREAENAVFTAKQGGPTGAPGLGPGAPGLGPGVPGLGPGAPGLGPGGHGLGPGAGPGGAIASSSDAQLFDYRYVDDKGQPLQASESAYPYVKHPYAEFKMMPIRMSLMMDGRRLPKLLVECGNSNMPIEVRRVRILKELCQPVDLSAPASATGAGGPAGGMGGLGGYRPPTGGGAHGVPGGVSDRRGSPQDQAPGSFDVPVEIHAVIYIYNPPDHEKLGTGTAAKNPGESTAPTTPVGVPTPPVAPAAPSATPSPTPATVPRR